MTNDLISRRVLKFKLCQNCPYPLHLEYCVNKCWVNKELNAAPAVDAVENTTFAEILSNAINGLDSIGEYYSGFRNALRWVKAVVDGKAPDYETVPDRGRKDDADN